MRTRDPLTRHPPVTTRTARHSRDLYNCGRQFENAAIKDNACSKRYVQVEHQEQFPAAPYKKTEEPRTYLIPGSRYFTRDRRIPVTLPQFKLAA